MSHYWRQYSGEMEHLGDDVSEIADKVQKQRFGKSGVVSKSCGRRAYETTDETDQRRAHEHDDERDDAFHHVQWHDVLNANHAKLLKHPVQHLCTKHPPTHLQESKVKAMNGSSKLHQPQTHVSVTCCQTKLNGLRHKFSYVSWYLTYLHAVFQRDKSINLGGWFSNFTQFPKLALKHIHGWLLAIYPLFL